MPLLTIERIRQWMHRYDVTPRMLAEALDYSSAHMRKVLSGKVRLMPDNAPRIRHYFLSRKHDYEREAALMLQLDQCA